MVISMVCKSSFTISSTLSKCTTVLCVCVFSLPFVQSVCRIVCYVGSFAMCYNVYEHHKWLQPNVITYLVRCCSKCWLFTVMYTRRFSVFVFFFLSHDCVRASVCIVDLRFTIEQIGWWNNSTVLIECDHCMWHTNKVLFNVSLFSLNIFFCIFEMAKKKKPSKFNSYT